jgi:hypothetical protein
MKEKCREGKESIVFSCDRWHCLLTSGLAGDAEGGGAN